jgi:hypothetical protein
MPAFAPPDYRAEYSRFFVSANQCRHPLPFSTARLRLTTHLIPNP